MTTFDGREQAFENKFAHDAELEFKITVRRNKLLGEWAAAQLGLSAVDTEVYAKAVVQSDFIEVGDDDVIGKVLGDLIAAGIDASEQGVRKALSDAAAEARRQIMAA